MRFLYLLFIILTAYAPAARSADFLPPEQAFAFSAQLIDAQHIAVHYNIADGYHLYRDKFQFQLTGAQLASAVFPIGVSIQDPMFGPETIYRHQVTVILPFNHASGQQLQLESTAQGCAESGICYAPLHSYLQFKLTDLPRSTTNSNTANNSSTADQFTSILLHGHFWPIIGVFFGAGILLALTPCVFPMIPILSSLIVQQGTKTRSATFLLSVAYVLGMAITYTLAGVAAALSGNLISDTLQNPDVLAASAALFVVLALSMFGLYKLQLPNAVQSKFSEISTRFQNGHLLGTLVMGAISAVIIGPCVAPPLAAALAWIAQSHNMLLGGAALFCMAIGMGTPLLLIGLGASSVLPRSGAWMTSIQQFFGVVLLGMAIETLSSLLPVAIHILLWSTLLVLSAIYWRAVDTLPVHASGLQRLLKGVNILILTTGLMLLVGVLGGANNLLQPLDVFHTGTIAAPAQQATDNAITVHSIAQLNTQLALAQGKPVLLDFYADWCVSCKEMAATTFQDPNIQRQLSAFVLIRADVTDNTPDEDALRKQFGVFGPPALIMFNAQGTANANHAIGLQSVDELSAWLKQVAPLSTTATPNTTPPGDNTKLTPPPSLPSILGIPHA